MGHEPVDDDAVAAAFDRFLDGDDDDLTKVLTKYSAEYYVGVMFGFLTVLVRERLGAEPALASVIAYAKKVHHAADGEDTPPRWVVESALRAGAGDVVVMQQAPPEQLLEALGLSLREILLDLDLDAERRGALVEEGVRVVHQVAALLPATP